uniref:Zygote arrest 1 n=1 Tax=Ictidomys tridecemlineatus TaxID=43179 RepID=A0A287D3H1_ICTTR
MYPACAPYSYPYPAGAAGGDGWRYQRAQLMALLQGMRPRRTTSRDVAVQVNPRCDASVQCSLGRRTLLRRPRDPGPAASPGSEGPAGGDPSSPQPTRRGPEQGSPQSGALRPVRFPRTVAVYSPVVSRRLTAFLEGAEAAVGEQSPEATEEEREPSSAKPQGREEGEVSARKASQRRRSEEDHDDEAQATAGASWEPKLPPREAGDRKAAPQPSPRSPELTPAAGKAPDGGETTAACERSSLQSAEPGKVRLRFQFLEQKYGYYHCKDCNIRWESAYVWCVQGTNKVYFKQFCRTCQKSYNPYRVEDITCQSCKKTRCSCPIRLRHVDPKRPHRQDLCGRCKGKRLSCDSTFSFKYII